MNKFLVLIVFLLITVTISFSTFGDNINCEGKSYSYGCGCFGKQCSSSNTNEAGTDTLTGQNKVICDAVVTMTNTSDKNLVQGITDALLSYSDLSRLVKLSAVINVVKMWLAY